MSVGRIVLVEDNPVDVLLVREALKHHGVTCELEQYSNGEDAANAITAMVDVPALFLLDLNIPRVQGLDLLRVIRARRVLDEVPAAILTSSRDPSDRSESERLGANAYIIKSPGYQDFVTNVGGTIVQLLQRKMFRSCARTSLLRQHRGGPVRSRRVISPFRSAIRRRLRPE